MKVFSIIMHGSTTNIIDLGFKIVYDYTIKRTLHGV